MARYTIERNFVRVIGYIWMPNHVLCAYEYPLTAHDLEQLRDEQGRITRDDLDCWLSTHAGDFSQIIDFAASIGDTEYPWTTEKHDIVYWNIVEPELELELEP